jgi:hypothetical protein
MELNQEPAYLFTEVWKNVSNDLISILHAIVDSDLDSNRIQDIVDIQTILTIHNKMYDYYSEINSVPSVIDKEKTSVIDEHKKFVEVIQLWILNVVGNILDKKIEKISQSDNFVDEFTKLYLKYDKFIDICNGFAFNRILDFIVEFLLIEKEHFIIMLKMRLIHQNIDVLKSKLDEYMSVIVKNTKDNQIIIKNMIKLFIDIDNFSRQDRMYLHYFNNDVKNYVENFYETTAKNSFMYVELFENKIINELTNNIKSYVDINIENWTNSETISDNLIKLYNSEISNINNIIINTEENEDDENNKTDEIELHRELVGLKEKSKIKCATLLCDIIINANINHIGNEFKRILDKNSFVCSDDVKLKYKQIHYILTNHTNEMLDNIIIKHIINYIDEKIQSINLNFSHETDNAEKYLIKSYCEFISDVHNFNTVIFENKNTFSKSIHDFFKECVKRKINKKVKENEFKEINLTEQLALFCDRFLKQEFKEISNEDENDYIDKISSFLNYLPDKDVFIEIYKANQIRRLVESNYNFDLERELLMKFKKNYGSVYTKAAEDIISNIVQSKEVSDQYNNNLESSENTSKYSILSCNLLNCNDNQVNLDESIQSSLDAFAKYYKFKYQSKKISWVANISTVFIDIDYPKGKKEIHANFIQANALKIIGDKGRISLNNLLQITGMDINLVKINILPLYLSKIYNLVTRSEENGDPIPNNVPLKLTDYFELNVNYVAKHKKLSIVNISRQIVEKKDINDKIDEGRNITIESCIVRVMKSRKILSYNELQVVVIEQLHKLFVPQPKQIKLCIENLIVKEYLKRNDETHSIFEYLA